MDALFKRVRQLLPQMKEASQHNVSHRSNLPIERDCHERKHGRCDGHVGHEVVYRAVHRPERPVRVEHEDEVEGTVERGHQQVGHTQIQQEVVRYGAHPPMCCKKKSGSVR